MTRLVLALFGALVFVVPALAQLTKYGESCNDGIWRKLTEDEIFEKRLDDKLERFKKVVEEVQKRDHVSRTITTLVITCPMRGDKSFVSIKVFDGVQSSLMKILPTYGLYITAAHLRNTEEETLWREVRRHVCLIRGGLLESKRFTPDEQDPQILRKKFASDDLDSPVVKECMLQEALHSGDVEYALWLKQLLINTAEENSSRAQTVQRNLQERIDSLRAVPNLPRGVLDTIERLQRSFD